MSDAKLTEMFKKMFRCSSARISRFPDKMYLIVGKRRSSKKDGQQWYKSVDGEEYKPINFWYIDEKVIASGRNEKELIASAKEYKRLSGMSMEKWVKRFLAGKEKPLLRSEAA